MVDIDHAATIPISTHGFDDLAVRFLVTTRWCYDLDRPLSTRSTEHADGKTAGEGSDDFGHASIFREILVTAQRKEHLRACL